MKCNSNIYHVARIVLFVQIQMVDGPFYLFSRKYVEYLIRDVHVCI